MQEPAYLFYRYLDNPDLLKDKRQVISFIPLATMGSRSERLVPLGTSVTMVAHSDRKLKDIRIAPPEKKRTDVNSVTPQATVHLAEDQQTITVTFPDVRKTLEFDFDFKDEEGVRGRRPVLIVPVKDEAPKVKDLQLGVPARQIDVGNTGIKRYVITPDAAVLVRGKVEDDHGLAQLEYRYVLQELDFQYLFGEAKDSKKEEPKADDPNKDNDQKKAELEMNRAKLILQGFQFPMGPYGFYEAAYYGAVKEAVKEGSVKLMRSDLVLLQNARTYLNVKNERDLKVEEIDRLLSVQPGNRELLAKALGRTADKAVQEKVLEQLKEENKTASFLREAMSFAGMREGDPQRARLEQLISSDPAEALVQVLKKLQVNEEKTAAAIALLLKEPEKQLIKLYDLANEDRVGGFDVAAHLGFIKAAGTTDDPQKHYELRLTLVATDNNIFTRPGEVSAGLPYGFLIVSENELVALMMADQRRHAEVLAKSVSILAEARNALEEQLAMFRKSADEPTVLLLRLDAARMAVRNTGVVSKALQVRFGTLLEEMKFNRVKQKRQDNMRTAAWSSRWRRSTRPTSAVLPLPRRWPTSFTGNFRRMPTARTNPRAPMTCSS